MGSVQRFPLSCFFVLVWVFLFFHSKSASINRNTYIVHMDKSHMPKAFTTYHNWYHSIIDSLSSANPAPLAAHLPSSFLIYTYDHALHGFSVILSPDELQAVKKSPGFISAYRDQIVTLDTTHTPEFISPNPNTGLWSVSNFGKDVIIGVVDSGIWPESESFKDDGISMEVPARWNGTCEVGQSFNSSLCNNKLIGARYFNKGFIIANPHKPVTMNSARDTMGHGTYISSIAAGNFVKGVSFFGYAEGIAKGMAPHARLAIYKVFWDENKGYISDVLAGLDKAIADGVDVICTSYGSDDIPLENNPIAIASFAAINKGVLVSASAGNKGPTLGTVHNAFPWVLTATASSIDRLFAGRLILGNGLVIDGWTMFPGNASLQNLPLIYNFSLSACDNMLLSSSPHGIIICNVGYLPSQISYITKSNLLGVVLVADNSRLFETGGVPCACLVIRSQDAPVLLNYTKFGPEPSASMTFQLTLLGKQPAPIVANYASRGPSSSIPSILKPDIMAPGSLVLGAWTPETSTAQIKSDFLHSDYNIRYGTSVACPHAAGVAALLKRLHPDWSSAAIKSAIMTTAEQFDNAINPIREYSTSIKLRPASPLAMGAGQISPIQALDPGLIYDITPQEYVDFLCSTKLELQQIMTITGSDYNCIKANPDLNYPSFLVFYCDTTTLVIKKFRRIVTNVGRGNSTYRAMVTAPENSEVKSVAYGIGFQK